MNSPSDRYTHGHHESVLRSHVWRTAENSAAFLMPSLHRGQTILDVGCGPGTITVDLARLVAPGQVTGIDRSLEVLEVARRNAEDANVVNVSFRLGDVYDLEFADSSFDVVYAHQVLQHLSDPVRALREMRRVLASDGVAAVRDSDYGTFSWSPPDPRLDRWLALYHDITKRNGAEADAGRHLVDWVRGAGFDSFTTSYSQWHFRTDEERAWWGDLWADRVQKSEFAHQGLEFGLTTQSELNELSSAFLEWSERADADFVVTHTEVLARHARP